MRLDLRLVLRDCHEHLSHAVTYLVLDEVPDYEQGKQHSQSRIDEEEIVVGRAAEPEGKLVVNGLHKGFEQHSGQPAAYTYSKGKHQKLVLFGNIAEMIP